ncbi:hypothetical protein SDJN02_24174, partial [Cucurbita argyrosperma subsp. argyrosperma]
KKGKKKRKEKPNLKPCLPVLPHSFSPSPSPIFAAAARSPARLLGRRANHQSPPLSLAARHHSCVLL